MHARRRTLPRLTLPAVLLALAALACQVVNPTPISWAVTRTPPASPAAATALPASPLTPPPVPGTPTSPPHSAETAATAAPTALAAPHGSLPGWLVYAPAGGRQIVLHSISDGGDRTLTLPQPLLAGAELSRGVSPAGGLLAFRTGGANNASLALHLLQVQQGSLQTVTSLLAPDLENRVQTGDPAALQTAAAAAAPLGLAWSPDGRFLAYTAAVDGSSTDLYVYDAQTGRTKRLTRGSNQAAAPYWSPDGKWILHVELRPEGAGLVPAAVWEASPTQDDTRRLYTPPAGSLAEVFLGWTAAGDLLVCSQGSQGFYNLRIVPLSARWMEPVYTLPFTAAALDPLSRLLVIIQDDRTSPGSGLAPGIYSLALHAAAVTPLEEGAWDGVRWNAAAGAFTVSGSRQAAVFKPGEEPLNLHGENQALVSPDGLWLAGLGQGGARLYRPDGTRLQEWLAGPVWQGGWLPDSSGLFLVGEGGLYLVRFPQALAAPVAQDVPAGAAALIGPAASP